MINIYIHIGQIRLGQVRLGLGQVWVRLVRFPTPCAAFTIGWFHRPRTQVQVMPPIQISNPRLLAIHEVGGTSVPLCYSLLTSFLPRLGQLALSQSSLFFYLPFRNCIFILITDSGFQLPSYDDANTIRTNLPKTLDLQ